MSNRAYRVNKLELDEGSSFNLASDTKLCEFLGIYDHLDDDACGFVYVPVENLKAALKIKGLLNNEQRIKMAFADDIKFAKKHGNDYVLYQIF